MRSSAIWFHNGRPEAVQKLNIRGSKRDRSHETRTCAKFAPPTSTKLSSFVASGDVNWIGDSLQEPWTVATIRQEKRFKTRAKMFSKHKPHAGHRNWPWPSNSPERGMKHIFLANLAQIRSAVPEIFHTQTKKSQTAPKAERYAVHCVR